MELLFTLALRVGAFWVFGQLFTYAARADEEKGRKRLPTAWTFCVIATLITYAAQTGAFNSSYPE